MTEYFPVFFDIETTGFNPTIPRWHDRIASEVTGVAVGYVRDWDEGGSDRVVESFMNRGRQEYETLERTREYLIEVENQLEGVDKEPFLVGHNIREFDVLYWAARCARYRQDPYPISHGWKRLDTLRALSLPEGHGVKGVNNNNYPSQQAYADYLGIDYVDELDGSDMPDAFKRGDYDQIERHVVDDIEVAMEIFMQERHDMVNYFWSHYGDRLEGDKPNFVDEVRIPYNKDE